MKYTELPVLGRACSRLVLGSMAFRLENKSHWWDLMDAFVEAGGNCIDTAVTYYGGQSERVIGEWLANNPGAEMMILTKGAHPKGDGKPRVNPTEIAKDIAESLEKLGIETIDLYLLHRDDPKVPVGELVDCLNEHKRAGRIRAFGGSNWSTSRLEEANGYARAHGLEGFSVSSPNLSLAVPREARWPGCIHVETNDLAWYERHRMPVFSWSAQAGGFFTGRFSPERRDNQEMVRVYYTDDNWRRFERATRLGEAKGVDANTIALAYVLHQRFPTFALIGPVNREELASSLPALNVTLTEDEVLWLDGRSEKAPTGI